MWCGGVGCLCRMYAPPAAASDRGQMPLEAECGDAKGLRRGRAGGMSGCTTGKPRRIAACDLRVWRGSRLQSWAAAARERYGRMAVRGGSGRSMGCVKEAARLGRIGAMWLGAERACVWVARAEGWV